MSLKEQMIADLAIVFNLNEFGEEHEVNGQTLTVVIEIPSDAPLQTGEAWAGFTQHERRVHVTASDMPVVPAVGASITLDGVAMTVTDNPVQAGMLTLVLIPAPNPYPTACTILNPGLPNPTDYGRTRTGASSVAAMCRYVMSRELVRDDGGGEVYSTATAWLPVSASIPAYGSMTIGATSYMVLQVLQVVDPYGQAEWKVLLG